jgi:hypothetical protein
MTEPRTRRRSIQFSLRALVVLVFLTSLPMGWLGAEIQRARKQRGAVQAITRAGGFVYYDYQVRGNSDPDIDAVPPGPRWLRSLLGIDFVARVVEAGVVRGGLEHATVLSSLEVLVVDYPVSDEDLKYLAACRSLHRLKTLSLVDGTTAGDDLADQVQGMTQLRMLYVRDSRLTSKGVRRLQSALPHCLVLREDSR